MLVCFHLGKQILLPAKVQPERPCADTKAPALFCLTSFSLVMSLVFWKSWMISFTSLSKSERTSMNPELMGPMSSSRMEVRNGWIFSVQHFWAGSETLAEGSHRTTVAFRDSERNNWNHLFTVNFVFFLGVTFPEVMRV